MSVGGPVLIELAAWPVTPSQVNLSWTEPSGGASGYRLLRNGSQIGFANGTSATDGSASPNTHYCYQVQSIGVSAQSNIACVTTPGTAPGWVIASIREALEPADLELAVDSSQNAHLVYYNTATAHLMYATNRSGAWETETVDSTGDMGRANSIGLDQAGKVHTVYWDFTNDRLMYATNASGMWATTIAASNGGGHTSLVLDAAGKAHAGYTQWPSTIRYATNQSGSWASVFIGSSSSGQPSATSIALDSAEKVHLSYVVGSALRYATNGSGSWSQTVLDLSAILGSVSHMTIDSADRLSISFWRTTFQYELARATNPLGIWSTEVVDAQYWFGRHTSIATDSADAVHIAYEDANLDLKYATNRAGFWQTEFVDALGNVGRYNSIAVDSSGRVHIAYFDATNRAIKYAVK